MSPHLFQASSVSLPTLQSREVGEKLEIGSGFKIPAFTDAIADTHLNSMDPVVAAKFYAIMEAVADRVDMHRNIEETLGKGRMEKCLKRSLLGNWEGVY